MGSYLYPLFKHLYDQHGLVLVDSELQDIVEVCRALDTTITTPKGGGMTRTYQIQSGNGLGVVIINANSPEDAIKTLREKRGQDGRDWDNLYAWQYDGDFRITLI